MQELPEADTHQRMLFDDRQRSEPDFFSRIVVRIPFSTIRKLADQNRTARNRHDEAYQADGKPNLTRNPAASANGCQHDHCGGGDGGASRKRFQDSEYEQCTVQARGGTPDQICSVNGEGDGCGQSNQEEGSEIVCVVRRETDDTLVSQNDVRKQMQDADDDDRHKEECSPSCRLVTRVFREAQECESKKCIFVPEIERFKMAAMNSEDGDQHGSQQYNDSGYKQRMNPLFRVPRTYRAEYGNE